jgi:phosphoadenosine phosphosulfate reductase
MDQTLAAFQGLEERALLAKAVHEYAGKIALLSAFNPEDVIIAFWLKKMEVDVPILFLETQKHFPETLRYVKEVTAQLDLNVQWLSPDPALVKKIDENGELWKYQVNRCCWLRKVEPINSALTEGGYTALITGRRIEQTPERHDMANAEIDEEGRIKFNPLRNWTRAHRDEYMQKHNLPHHPLYKLGYLSIGCAPCTTPVYPGEEERAGRWRHTRLNTNDAGKTECGLHVADGTTHTTDDTN